MDIKLMPDKYKKKGIGGGLKLSKIFILKSDSWFVFSFILLALVVLGCFGLWGYKINLKQEKNSFVQKFEELNSQRDLELEASLAELKEKIESFKTILAERAYSSNAFKILEELTIPQVHYVGFKADVSTAIVTIGVEASNYEALAKQLFIFEDDSRIEKIDFSEIKLEKSGWVSSKLDLQLNPRFLYYE